MYVHVGCTLSVKVLEVLELCTWKCDAMIVMLLCFHTLESTAVSLLNVLFI